MNEPENTISEQTIIWLSILATGGLVIMWAAFWFAATRGKDSVTSILMSPAFFRTVTVMGVVAATVVLSLAGRLQGNITGAILSGIVGYVLGSVFSHDRQKKDSIHKEDNAA